jgi:hypothetical protein
MNQLERFTESEPEINGFLVAGLVDLHATEAASLIERAFAAGRVDPTIMGDREVVQAKLGLHSPEAVGQRRARELPQTPFPSTASERTPPQSSTRDSHQREAARRKAKGKLAKQSRKKNRKK